MRPCSCLIHVNPGWWLRMITTESRASGVIAFLHREVHADDLLMVSENLRHPSQSPGFASAQQRNPVE